MALNRIQFQRGLSLVEFLDRYGSEEKCEAALVALRWPKGFVCPRCAGSAHSLTFNGRRLWECLNRHCRYQCSAIAGSVFQDTKLPLTTWFLAMYWMTQSKNSIAALELRRLLGVSYPTALLMKHKLMQVMSEREAERRLDGTVEIDESYLGGEASGKRGRGADKKVPFVAAVSRNRLGRPVAVRFDAIEDVGRSSFAHWMGAALAPGARLVSDGWPALAAAATEQRIEQRRFVSGGGKTAARHPEMKWVNTLQSNLKTAISGTLHAFDFKRHAQRYLGEFAYRFNRRVNLPTMLPRLIHRCVNTTPRTKQMLYVPESC
jgi:hypothetical protein